MFKIDNNIPMPVVSVKSHNIYETADKLEEGQSFLATGILLNSSTYAICKLIKKTGKKFTKRSEKDGVRIWRIE